MWNENGKRNGPYGGLHCETYKSTVFFKQCETRLFARIRFAEMNPDGSDADADADEPFPIGVSEPIVHLNGLHFHGIAHPPVVEHTPIRPSFHHLSAKELSIEFSRMPLELPIHVEHDLDRHVGEVMGGMFDKRNGLRLYCTIWDEEAIRSVERKELQCLSLGVQNITDPRTGDVQKTVKEVSLVEQSFHTGNLIEQIGDYIPPQKDAHKDEFGVITDYKTKFRGLTITTERIAYDELRVTYDKLDASADLRFVKKYYTEYTHCFTQKGCFAVPKFETLYSIQGRGEFPTKTLKDTASMFQIFAARRHRWAFSLWKNWFERCRTAKELQCKLEKYYGFTTTGRRERVHVIRNKCLATLYSVEIHFNLWKQRIGAMRADRLEMLATRHAIGACYAKWNRFRKQVKAQRAARDLLRGEQQQQEAAKKSPSKRKKKKGKRPLVSELPSIEEDGVATTVLNLVDLADLKTIEPKEESSSSTCVDVASSSVASALACVICFHGASEFACVPCGHRCLCQRCSEQFKSANAQCPMCREPMLMVMKVYG